MYRTGRCRDQSWKVFVDIVLPKLFCVLCMMHMIDLSGVRGFQTTVVQGCMEYGARKLFFNVSLSHKSLQFSKTKFCL